MKTKALNTINTKLKTIPDDFLGDIIQYLDFISFKTDDWANTLSADQIKIIKQGEKDLRTGKVISHKAAMLEIRSHLKTK
jgi:hypothetical protein